MTTRIVLGELRQRLQAQLDMCRRERAECLQAESAARAAGIKVEDPLDNAKVSTYFSSLAGQALAALQGDDDLLQIGYQTPFRNRTSGEWMLDAAVVIKAKPYRLVERILCAMECESSTAMDAFLTDFGKLLNTKADTKLYLHGLNHASIQGAERHVHTRLQQAAEIIGRLDRDANWFFGFWPSPETYEPYASIWDDLDGRFSYLRDIRLFELTGGTIVPALSQH